MAIRVICPGCMKTFEVDDRFAGQKGPCPNCGHIIEIPKEQLIIHAPDDITDGKKTRKNLAGHDARPILQERFTFTGKQVVLGVVGAVAMFLISYGVGLIHNGWVSLIAGLALALVAGYPIANVGYMVLRDPNDLDKTMFEYPYERHMHALYTALVFAGSWAVFEGFVHYLGSSGLFACLYLVPIALIGSFGAVIFFDMNFGSALLMYLVFLFAAVIGRGLIITDGWSPNGWIWNANRRSVAVAPKNPAGNAQKKTSENAGKDSEPGKKETPDASKRPEPESPAISREAPNVDPTKPRRRR